MTPERWQHIKELFHAAVELDASERVAFLDEVCAGDADLRRQVGALLASHEGAPSFLEEPAVEVAAQMMAEDQASSPVRQIIGPFKIVKRLGTGGMGDVYLAEDNRLGRNVALKLLPDYFITDHERVRRFKQEARAASALNHPNVATIYDIGESEGTIYIAMEYVEGQTLDQKMSGRPLDSTEVLDIAVQVAEALGEAHTKGITHRDIKPGNIMVTARGQVKVLDFGLAKVTKPEREALAGDVSMQAGTEPGVLMGTVAYMSPEQALGHEVDHRSDIFSFGLVLYEMTTGRRPFSGTTTGETLDQIIHGEPEAIARFNANAPAELERIIRRCLEKDRERRYQSAYELLIHLKNLRRDLDSGEGAARPTSSAEYLVRQIKRRKRGALITLMVLVLAAAAAFFYFTRQPVLTDKDTILLADFENKTGEEIFDGMLRQGLAIQLQQSPFLNLFPEAQMRHELTLMKRSPHERVTAELAREICERQNLKALVAGSLAPLGSHYVITLEAINGQSGETLAREQVQAENKEQVLRALSQAATRLRQQLGESLNSIQRFNRPLLEGTTAKLEAFKAFSQALELAVSGRLLEAIPFHQRAIELDPDFAYAYCQLAVMYEVTNRPALATVYAKKSYELKEQAGENEKFRIAHLYHRIVTGDLNKAIEALQLQKRTYPRDWSGLIDLALAYHLLGQSEQAIAEAREAIRLDPNFAAPYGVLAWALVRLNRFAEASDVLAQALPQGLEHTQFHSILYQVAFIQGDTAGMQQQLEWASGKPNEYVALDWQTGAAAFAGQWRRAQELARRAIDLATRNDAKEVAAQYAAEAALREAVIQSPGVSLPPPKGGTLNEGCALNVKQSLALERNQVTLTRAALALALCGASSQAQPLVDELVKQYPQNTVINGLWLPVIRAAMELHRGNAAQAIEQLQAATRYEPAAEFWPQYLRGQAYLKLSQAAEAAAEFQKILDHRGQAPLSALYPLAHLGMARAAALTGDLATSRKVYENFLTLWKDADSDLPILSAAKKEYGS